MQVAPSDSRTVFLFGTNGYSFVAQNCTKTIKLIKHEPKLYDIKINRVDYQYILGLMDRQCNEFDEECDSNERSLLASKDMGESWQKILDNVIEASW